MKLKYLLGLFLCLLVIPSTAFAQTDKAKGHIPEGLDIELREKTLFVYGFYVSYMSGVIYTPRADLQDALLKAFTTSRLRKKIQQYDYDVLLDAQDCIETCMNTLYVTPLPNDWFEVKYRWMAHAPELLGEEHRVLVQLIQHKGSYKIAQIKPNEETPIIH